MSANIQSNRLSQIVAWAIAILFALGFFIGPVGMWTGAILGVWVVGTQKPWRGFLWIVAATLLFSLPATWHTFSRTVVAQGIGHIPEFLGLVSFAVLFNVLPFTFHRLVSPRLPGFLGTFPFPVGAVALSALVTEFHLGDVLMSNRLTFLVCWFAAVVVWMWNNEFRAGKIAAGRNVFLPVYLLAAVIALIPALRGAAFILANPFDAWLGWFCVAGAFLLGVVAILRPVRQKSWAERPGTVARLLSPFSREPLRLVSERRGEELVSKAGERFPIRDGIAVFLQPEDLTGDNGKYNHVYETIGGFYDDIQRIFCALKGFDRDAYFRSYMSLVEVKPGDSVLETSVGTGLNFQYLPPGVELSGLDLSPEMLVNCKRNLRRWGLDAELYLCNAESLPFADSSFDVVFHVGGINFFNDRAKAIREMIRVARPGSLLLIADETEKHVKEVYERQPGSKWKNRKEPVSPPVDLVPAEMEDVHLVQLRSDEWYVLTFRKPALAEDCPGDVGAVGEPVACAAGKATIGG